MKHNILTLFLAILFIMVGTNVSADSVVINSIQYFLSDFDYTASVSRKSPYYTGAIVIPSSVTYSNKTYSVTCIGDSAFYSCAGLTSITIPNSVTSIGQNAFWNCSGLAEVHITDIAAWCKISFGNYLSNPLYYAHHLFMDGKEITDLVIPNSVTSIGNYAFEGCSCLTSIDIPNSVTSIGKCAFYGCSGLTSIDIPNSVTSIGGSAFYNCSKLTKVTIPNSVTSIVGSAFYGCSGLTSVTIPNSVTSIGNYAFRGCSGLTSIDIPNSVTSIGDEAFEGTAWYKKQLDGLVYAGKVAYRYKGTMPANTFITIKEGTLGIGDGAFRNCSGLTSIDIPNSVTSIGSSAFEGCSKLTSITIPNSVTSIGEYAFQSCSKLTSVTIPNSVTSIGHYAFYYCSKLTSVHITDIAAWCKISFGNYLSNPLYYAHHLFMDGKEITDLVIPNSVTSIGNYAFEGCSCLTSIDIPNSVTSIGSSAFSDCSKLSSVIIPNSVTSIGSSAFNGCYFEKKNFINNSSLNAEANSYWGATIVDSRNDGFVIKDGTLLKYTGNDASVTIPNSVTSIGERAFYNCSGLTSITIPNSVTSIGDYAFYYCYGLTSVTIPNSVTSIGERAFYNCYGLTQVTLNNNDIVSKSYSSSSTLGSIFGSQVKEYILGDDVTSIGSSAFRNCSGLTSVTIPNSVTSIVGSAFYGCSGLTSVTIPNSVTSIGAWAFYGCSGLTSVHITDIAAWCKISFSNYDANPLSNAKHLFMDGKEITDLVIPNSVTSIGERAFYNCSGLTSIDIPNSVTSIGEYAFRGCSGLTSIDIPNSVTSIGNYAFQYCSGLTSVTIGNSVTRIGGSAFENCSKLTSITIPNSVTSIGSSAFFGCSGLKEVKSEILAPFTFGSNAFSNISSNCVLAVPYGTKDAYIAKGWTTSVFKGGVKEDKPIVDGIYYVFNSDTKQATVTAGENKYSSNVIIPSSVTFNGTEYSVTCIGDSAFYNCSGLTSIEMPSNVTSIGSSAFFGCAGELIVNCKIPSASQSTNGAFYGSKFKSVTIGEDILSIGDYAFYDSDSLISVTVPNSVTSIGSSAFSSCEVLTRVSINSNSIVSTGDYSLCSIFGSQVKEYIIGKNVTSIWAGKFCDCTDLAYITIPTSVKSIGNSAFRNCPKLESVAIPNSVTSIGEYALSDCANLKSVTIGSGVQVIGKDVFENHHPSKVFWLTNTPPEGYAYAEGSINYVSNTRYTEFSNVIRYSSLSSIFEVDGIRYVPVNPSARTCDAIDCTYDEYIDSINIGEKVTYRGIALSVKQVSPYTCYENKYIKDINLSFKGDIGAKAFYGCSNMITAELGNGILSIGESGFSSCSKLESIVIPDSVVVINDSTFCDCIVLNSAKIGRGVESIGRYAFSGCSVLPNIKIPQSVASIADYAFRGCIGMKTVVMSNGDSELALSSNDSNPLFVDCPLDSVYIGRNILYETSADYGYSPFYRNKTLRTVVITDMETEISDNEFYSCTNLQSFKIGDGVTRFGNWAFSGCSSLKSLGFGTELQSIGQEAFSDCSAVTVIVSRTEIPPVCESQALEDINKWECTLYVPEGTSPDYQEADQWKDFWYMEEGAPYVVIRGDVNGDEFVNMKDVMFVTNIILGIEDATEAADVNNDGKINIQDVMFIVNYIKNGKFPDE